MFAVAKFASTCHSFSCNCNFISPCHRKRNINDFTIVVDMSTLQWHLQAMHKHEYYKWCEKNTFNSKLPSDVAARKAKILESHISQGTLEGHPAGHTILYSDKAFKSAAIQWLVETDQPISAFQHQAFEDLINIASHTKEAVKIPKRASTR
ncbi:uncharacterized protein LAESUDRAFT_647966 [Laetiporus sulphureus 93-53]|uniref:Uncharacterized protein n=1 Tax=Laetiporus sulphureus 93-53 TaxID=1314785 RepID=A0A165FFK0_9APHY|nr:uncharacterized protein LAESUDRAFT_647966 [Laetiporus sulphureus 93-53]KZT08895.1 hypothetical protein LAESUDRAFT_647966 [Laetiporus sulphureus 93-53]